MENFSFQLIFLVFLAYQEQRERQASFPFIKTIHASLKSYSDKQPNNIFPDEIKSYKILRQLVIEAGKSIPEDQADTKTDYLTYETSDRKNYILRLNIRRLGYSTFSALILVFLQIHVSNTEISSRIS